MEQDHEATTVPALDLPLSAEEARVIGCLISVCTAGGMGVATILER